MKIHELTRNIFSIFSVILSCLTQVDVAQDKRDTSMASLCLKILESSLTEPEFMKHFLNKEGGHSYSTGSFLSCTPLYTSTTLCFCEILWMLFIICFDSFLSLRSVNFMTFYCCIPSALKYASMHICPINNS